ncbi:MAG: hypothetical protein KAQ75_02545 [Bacteroidales bacterium]|nr:hypothetical protein [Bacteroidales bacterium]
MRRLKKNYFIILMIASVILLMGFTYQDLPIDKEDQKKLESAQKLNIEAQELNDKANLLYSEIADYDVSNPKNDKKIESLKNKALDIQLNALELQKEANFLEYSVYKKIIPGLKQDYIKTNEIPLKAKLLAESADELFYKAEKSRNEAYQLDKDEKESRFTKLNEAQEFEKDGIDKQKQIIDIYIGKTIIESDTQEISSSGIDDNIVINDDLLQAYMNYMAQTSMSPIESLKELIFSDSLSSSNLRNTWEEYLYEKPQAEVSETLEQDSSLEVISRDIAMQSDNGSYDDLKDETPKEITKEYNDQSEDIIDDDIIYKVQIAADKKTLSQNVLSRLYNGNMEIKMISEDGWNKYSIGDFNTFSEANNYKKTLGVNDAFVVAYKNGVKVDLLALKSEREKPIYKKDKIVSELSGGLFFKVQIAAAKMKLAENVLKSIYKGAELIDMIEEDGWYKYSVGKLSTYEQAVNLKSSVKVDGSFIVAYNNGDKVPLYLAKTGKVSSEPTHGKGIVFKVQIAADTKTLSSENLHKIYSGYEKIQRYEEDGWYKYSVGEFKTFAEANEFRKTCGVNGAFIISFQGDKKVNVLAATKMMRCYDPKIISDWPSNNNQVVFRIQISASNNEMSINQIKNIYCVEPNVYVIEENGWFKYSIGSFKKYQNALQIKEKSGVAGAFIVAYKNGKKLNIKEAINLSNK